MFQDSYAAFTEIAPFFATLADQRPTTLDEVRAILDGLGAVDETPRTSPYPDRPAVSRETRELADGVASLIREGAIGTARELLDEACRTETAMSAKRGQKS